MADAPLHTIVITPEVFGIGYDVTIEPAPSGVNLDREQPTYAAATGYAQALHLNWGWPIRDMTGETSS